MNVLRYLSRPTFDWFQAYAIVLAMNFGFEHWPKAVLAVVIGAFASVVVSRIARGGASREDETVDPQPGMTTK